MVSVITTSWHLRAGPWGTRFQCLLCLIYSFFLPGEGVVPEQENEVEAGQRRAARSRSSREGTGECEKGNPSAVRAVRDRCGYPPADRGLASKWRQPRQWPQLRARTLMIYTETSSILRKAPLWRQALPEHRLHGRGLWQCCFDRLKCRHLKSCSPWSIEGLH